MTGPIPPGLRRGPDCQIKLRNDRPSIVTHRNPYTLPVAVTAVAVVVTMATNTPTLARVLAIILCGICNSLYFAEALR